MAEIFGNTTATPIKPDLFRNKVDNTFDPKSENAQSGKALAPIFNKKVEIWQPNTKYEVGEEVLFLCTNSVKNAYFYYGKCIKEHTSPNKTDYTPENLYWESKHISVQYAKEAVYDIVGNEIHNTYATKEELENSVKPQKQTFENDETITVTDNTEYVADGEITNLTIIYPDTDFICSFNFTLASEGVIEIVLPDSKYIGGAPTFTNGDTWELNIKNGVVVGGKVE